jgi:hypothetical protein
MRAAVITALVVSVVTIVAISARGDFVRGRFEYGLVIPQVPVAQAPFDSEDDGEPILELWVD